MQSIPTPWSNPWGVSWKTDKLHMKNLWMIGIMRLDMRPEIIHDRLKNVPKGLDLPAVTFIPNPEGTTQQPKQWWIDQSVPRHKKLPIYAV